MFAENMSLMVPPELLQHTSASVTLSNAFRLAVCTHAKGEEPKAPARKRKTIRAAILGEAAATAFQMVNMM